MPNLTSIRGKRPLKLNPPLEHIEQEQVVDWLEIQKLRHPKKLLKFSALPFDTFTKSWKVKNKNTRIGVRSGVPDLLIVFDTCIVFIEMKRQKGERYRLVSSEPTKEQKEWIKVLNLPSSVYSQACYGHKEAITFLEQFL
jgi:hypothetical protein